MYCPSCGNDNPSEARFCLSCGISLGDPSLSATATVKSDSLRYHGLDVLRGFAMLLGIVLHAALPFMSNIEAFWPADESSSHLTTTIFHFIHIWRMPLFFILVGFFANLVISKHSWRSWWGNRLLRIGLPIIVFSPLMSLTIPWIFSYGKTGELTLFYSSEGQPYHLWFLWHLMIFVILTAIFRPIYLVGVGILGDLDRSRLGLIGGGFRKAKSVLSGILFRSRFPIVFIILCCGINISTGGELIANPGASLLYFAFGYSLYGNASLFTFLKTHWKYYLLAGFIGFILYMILNVTESTNLVTHLYISSEIEIDITEILQPLQYLLRITCAVLFSYAFIGLSEDRFGSYNAKLRFISDGAYWMYLIHLPIVTFITFAMFNLQMPAEIKFVIAIVFTTAICLVTYKYLVRSTLIGLLLNGKRHPFKLTGV